MAYVRLRNKFDPESDKPFRLSRSKLELFINCPRCFYLDRRLGIGQPPGYPFNLNNAVDTLLKKEFDEYRERGLPHPMMTENNISAVPYRHERINEWRDALHAGITHHHEPSRLLLTGAVDDVWVNGAGELIIVDYKATSKIDRVSIDADWQMGYKRQMDIYAWLFSRNQFQVADTGYFVYCNAKTTPARFEQKLIFDISFLPYKTNTAWVESALHKARECLMLPATPDRSETCSFCQYTKALDEAHAQMALF